ncbi:hypothetical protein [Microlunatus flavus]|uniref:Uncharacterized protein n=1 Tax=Microlunatus flavus TaxID=1036181 RepID=A0A1H9BZN4_9ACTN|nr:hypothetical protein [Microlunatus flavus]SEP94456.1 hypothetical protein SAMN05421756_10221 [Microlunatus flavus]
MSALLAPRSAGPAAGVAKGRLVAPGTRALLLTFAVLTLVATNQLFVLAADTDRWFAWTIQPPLTAAFVGAGYAAGFLLVVLVLRTRVWAEARLTLVSVLVFATASLVATLLHTDRFHFGAPEPVARFAAWFWLAVYVVVPVGLAVVVVRSHRAPGADPPRSVRLPVALKGALVLHAVVLLPVAVALLVSPGTAAVLWPWALTPLTAQMVGGWLLAFGVVAVGALLEDDLHRLSGPALAYAVFGLLQLLALALHGEAVRWGSPQAAAYLGVLVTVPVVGLAGWLAARRHPR